jgi:hypothetical protein
MMAGRTSSIRKYRLYLGVSWKLHIDVGIAGLKESPEQVLQFHGFLAGAFERTGAVVNSPHGHSSFRTVWIR